jgi:hypothetical protein
MKYVNKTFSVAVGCGKLTDEEYAIRVGAIVLPPPRPVSPPGKLRPSLMFILNANESPLTPQLVRIALKEARSCVSARASAAQLAAWEHVAISVGAIEFKADEFPEFPPTKLTLAGRPLRLDSTVPENVLEFWDDAGNVLARIEHLRIP